MKLHKIALAILLGAASMAASADEDLGSPNTSIDSSSSIDGATKKGNPDSLQILRPRFGETMRGTKTVQAVLRVGDGIHPESLRITLNGKNVTRHLHKEECTKNACKWTMELTKGDRLRSGTNEIRAAGRGHKDGIELARVSFDYYYGLGAGQNQPNYVPPSVGLSLTPGGAQPWVTLTTGTPAGLQDNLDPTAVLAALPRYDISNRRHNAMQLTVSGRGTESFHSCPARRVYCPGDSATLKSDLAGLPAGTELVLVGTTQNNNADASLDTRALAARTIRVIPLPGNRRATRQSESREPRPAAPTKIITCLAISAKLTSKTRSPTASWQRMEAVITTSTPPTTCNSRFTRTTRPSALRPSRSATIPDRH